MMLIDSGLLFWAMFYSWHTGWPYNWHILCVRLKVIRLNFIKYWPIFKLVSLAESGEHL